MDDRREGDSTKIEGNVGPGSAVGPGRVNAENIVGRDQIQLMFNFQPGADQEQVDLRLSREQLLAALVDYEKYVGLYSYNDPGDRQWHADIIGRARAACLRVNDAPSVTDIRLAEALPQAFQYNGIESLPSVSESAGDRVHEIHRLHFIADKRLTPYFVMDKDNPEEARLWGPYLSRNRDALRHAVARVVQLIEQYASNSDRD